MNNLINYSNIFCFVNLILNQIIIELIIKFNFYQKVKRIYAKCRDVSIIIRYHFDLNLIIHQIRIEI